MASPSVWIGAVASAITSLSNGSGATSSMRRYTYRRTRTRPRHGIASPRTSISITASDCIKAWIAAPRAWSFDEALGIANPGQEEKGLVQTTSYRHNNAYQTRGGSE